MVVDLGIWSVEMGREGFPGAKRTLRVFVIIDQRGLGGGEKGKGATGVEKIMLGFPNREDSRDGIEITTFSF